MLRRTTHVILGFLTALLLVLIASCGGDKGTEPGQPEQQPVVLREETTNIPPDSSASIRSYDTTGIIVINASSSYARTIDSGSVIIGQDDDKAPDGFLRKVVSKTTAGDSTVLRTEQATIVEAFEELNISETYQLRPTDVKSYDIRKGAVFKPAADNETFVVVLDCVFYDQDGDENTTDDQIRVDGDFAFTAELFAEIQTRWFSLEKFETSIQTTQDVDLDLTANLQWQFDQGIEVELAEFHLGAIPIGGFVWLTPTLTVVAHIHGDMTVTFQTAIDYNQQLRYGFGFAESEFYDISEFVKEFDYEPPQVTTEFDFEAGAALNASCLLYGVAGPYMAGKAGFHFQSVLELSPQTELNFELDAILYARVGIECDILGLDYNKEYQLYSHLIGVWVFPSGNYGTVTDIDGNVYQTIRIGDQWWMMENLKVTHYRNGDPIPHVTDNSTWDGLTSGAYCNYDNDINNVETYGRLYNWYAVSDSREIAPEGWHVPTDEEWKQLEMYLGMSQAEAEGTGWRGTDEGGKLKEMGSTHWLSPNTGATNESGFTALPGGLRGDVGTNGIGLWAKFWSSTVGYGGAWNRTLFYYYSQVGRDDVVRDAGESVRCVQD